MGVWYCVPNHPRYYTPITLFLFPAASREVGCVAHAFFSPPDHVECSVPTGGHPRDAVCAAGSSVVLLDLCSAGCHGRPNVRAHQIFGHQIPVEWYCRWPSSVSIGIMLIASNQISFQFVQSHYLFSFKFYAHKFIKVSAASTSFFLSLFITCHLSLIV
jgi:hypothetical protein